MQNLLLLVRFKMQLKTDDWFEFLSCDDIISLSILLGHYLDCVPFMQITKTAKILGRLIERSEQCTNGGLYSMKTMAASPTYCMGGVNIIECFTKTQLNSLFGQWMPAAKPCTGPVTSDESVLPITYKWLLELRFTIVECNKAMCRWPWEIWGSKVLSVICVATLTLDFFIEHQIIYRTN